MSSNICAEEVKFVSKKYGVSLPTAKQYLMAEHKRHSLLEQISNATDFDDLKSVLCEIVKDTYPSFSNNKGSY